MAHVADEAFFEYFERYSCHSKYDIAALLATWFPETAWRITPRRKIYQPQPRAMLYFDSAALGVAYLRLEKETTDENAAILSPASK